VYGTGYSIENMWRMWKVFLIGMFFIYNVKDEYEFVYLKTKKCPFCKVLDSREGP